MKLGHSPYADLSVNLCAISYLLVSTFTPNQISFCSILKSAPSRQLSNSIKLVGIDTRVLSDDDYRVRQWYYTYEQRPPDL